MLARLDNAPGVKESRVDWSGRYFLIALDPGGDDARVAGEAGPILGEASRRLDGEAAALKIDAYRHGEPWMRSGETLRLSREEARILAARRAEEAARSAGLNEEQSRRVAAVLEEEMAAAFERIHASGKPPEGRFSAEWSTVVDRVAARSREFLSEEQARRVVAALGAPFSR